MDLSSRLSSQPPIQYSAFCPFQKQECPSSLVDCANGFGKPFACRASRICEGQFIHGTVASGPCTGPVESVEGVEGAALEDSEEEMEAEAAAVS